MVGVDIPLGEGFVQWRGDFSGTAEDHQGHEEHLKKQGAALGHPGSAGSRGGRRQAGWGGRGLPVGAGENYVTLSTWGVWIKH
jgi:hypothetical protein